MVPEPRGRRRAGAPDVALAIAAHRPKRVLCRRVRCVVPAPVLGWPDGPVCLARRPLVASVNDAKRFEGCEGNRKVEGSDQVVFRCFIHGLLFSVTEHMFVR